MTKDLPARMLRLLSLLQTRRERSGAELAEQLGVTLRTIRRDIERLRELGYPVEGTTGHAGGYHLAAGTHMPPLLLDDEEAIAITVALSTASSAVTGITDAAVRALAKLQQILPTRLRHQVSALHAATTSWAMTRDHPVDPGTLAALAVACRDHERVTFTYRTRHGHTGRRRVEPHALVAGTDRWYLLAYDTEAHDWRTLRVDRITDLMPTGHRVAPRDLPARDPATYVAESLAQATATFQLRATIATDAATVRARTWILAERVQPVDENTCTVDLAADNPRDIAVHLIDLGEATTINGSPDLAPHLIRWAHLLLDTAETLTRRTESE
ncbi:helix-turn-helix transcriptional regulator [Nocardia sp. NPDC049149]|uniref:helix-turn-helix transcriptional regulator n=1 Tax=Nocardia sp. NPDC049149 TaxID=3364315 RepID=UPI0037134B5C